MTENPADYKIYIVTGGPVMAAKEKCEQQQIAFQKRRDELVAEVKAKGTLLDMTGIAGFIFAENPDETQWRRLTGRGVPPNAWFPRAKTGKELIARMQAPEAQYPDSYFFQRQLGLNSMAFTGRSTPGRTGIPILTLALGEEFGKMLLWVPNFHGTEKWAPPEEGTELLPTATVLRLQAEKIEHEASLQALKEERGDKPFPYQKLMISIDQASKSWAVFDEGPNMRKPFKVYFDEDWALVQALEWCAAAGCATPSIARPKVSSFTSVG